MDRSAGSNRRAIAAPLLISLGMVFLFVWLFSAALHKPQPHELPIGFVGPAMALPSVEAGLEGRTRREPSASAPLPPPTRPARPSVSARSWGPRSWAPETR